MVHTQDGRNKEDVDLPSMRHTEKQEEPVKNETKMFEDYTLLFCCHFISSRLPFLDTLVAPT